MYVLCMEVLFVDLHPPLLLDESAFTMEDLAGEAAHGMKLAASLSRASRKKLLKV